jgi:hypothetical protein
MEKPTFTRVCLSDVRVIMVIMRVPVVELLCGDGMASALMYLLSSARECLLPCLFVPDIKCRRFPRTRLCWCLSDTESPWVWLPEVRVCP